MPLPTGTWKMNVNGKELDFTIQSVQVQEGQGVFSAFLLAESLTGFWDEVSQTITFGLTKGQGPGGVAAVFKGYLFRSPENPEPGRDVVATLAGSLKLLKYYKFHHNLKLGHYLRYSLLVYAPLRKVLNEVRPREPA